jgi:hypothetical protein
MLVSFLNCAATREAIIRLMRQTKQ